MNSISDLAERIRTGEVDTELEEVYTGAVDDHRERLSALAARFAERFDAPEVALFSAPGRTELGGNHTDHNAGRVLAGSVTLDTVAVAAPRNDMTAEVVSEGFDGVIRVDLTDLEPNEAEHGHPAALIRGVSAFFGDRGHRIGGFSAAVTSRVGTGSGLSSSASFEVLVATVLSHLYNGGSLSPVELARAGRRAENHFFGKPSGLMDQIACATGGVVTIDFGDEDAPVVDRIPVSFRDHGYRLFAVDSGEDHADLTPEYASIVSEMGAVASFFGADTLRQVAYEQFMRRFPAVRAAAGDRAVLRALHFFRDNERVRRQSRLLEDGEIESYLAEVRESGSSSWRLLQNCYPAGAADNQGITVALALTDEFLAQAEPFPQPPRLRGAARVHGGGFAGTVQAYVPADRADAYRDTMQGAFGEDAVVELAIRDVGACRLL